MNRKTLFWGFLLGAAVGQSLVVWLAPKYLVWYFAPPAPMGLIVQCPFRGRSRACNRRLWWD